MTSTARGIVVEVIGDDRSAVRMWERQQLLATESSKIYRKAAISDAQSADIQVAARAKVIRASQVAVAQLAAAEAAAVDPATRAAATALLAEENAKLARAQGLAVTSTTRFSKATKEGERDLNKIVRGGLAGSGAFAELGRSLAFASTGFIAFAVGAGIIRDSIKAAQDEAVAQRQVARQLVTSGKSWDQYGAQIDKVLLKESHLAGFTKAELLTAFGFLVRVGGNVSHSLELTGLAADIARARQITLMAASIALSKALGGSVTALRRLGIVVPKNVSTTEALAFVTEKFAGQAKAGTTVAEKFHATLVDTGAVIGKDLLPIFNKYVGELTHWLTKMTESGRLQHDVNALVEDAVGLFKAVGGAIGFVDKITGSFANTLKILLGLQFARVIARTWIPVLVSLATKFGLVESAAKAATAAEIAAGEAGVAAGAGAAAAGTGKFGLLSLGATPGGPVLAAGLAAALLGDFLGSRVPKEGVAFGAGNDAGRLKVGVDGKITVRFLDTGSTGRPGGGRPGVFTITPVEARSLLGLAAFRPARAGQDSPNRIFAAQGRSLTPSQAGPTIFKSFTDPIFNQVAQARAQLTKSNKDDVAAAKQEIAIIKRQIAAGHLKGASLVQALNAEAQAIGVIQSAEADAAQKRAAAVQRAAERFAQLVDPLGLEVELLRFEAAGRSTLPVLRKLLAVARNALANAKGLKQEQQALEQIVNIQQQIKDATTTATAQFQVPAKLAFRLARDTALGRDTTKDLQAIRKALLRFIATHKHNLQALTDAYNQLADLNQQIGNTAQLALGLFKQQSFRALTEGLHLTAEQRRQLRARLSQRGPGGTIPGEGVGAGGFVINPDTGRPIHVHTRIDIDGQKVAENTTKHQQKRRRRNSSQRRGPNAGG